jgi:hypothetical protein
MYILYICIYMFLTIFSYQKDQGLTNFNNSYIYFVLFTYLNTLTLSYNNFGGQDNGSIDICSLSNHVRHTFIVRKHLMKVS